MKLYRRPVLYDLAMKEYDEQNKTSAAVRTGKIKSEVCLLLLHIPDTVMSDDDTTSV